MGEYTFLEVQVDRDGVAAVLDAIPGVAAVDDLDTGAEGTTERSAKPAGSAADNGTGDDTETPAGTDRPSAESEPGTRDRIASLWREWGLLGVGLSMVALGTAVAGLWWYRRRGSDEEEMEEKWDADSGIDTPAPTTTDGTTLGDEVAGTPVDETDGTAEPAGDLGEREREQSAAAATTPSERADERSRTDTDSEPDRDAESGSIDAAPLLGLAFLVATSALRRWLRRDADDRR